MAKGIFIRLQGGLYPADGEAAKIVARIRQREHCKADVTIPHDQRSLQHHRLYFALLNKVFDSLPERWHGEIPTVDVLRIRLAYTIGWTEVIQTGAGPREVPKSMDFRVGQAEFTQKIWEPTVRVILDTIIPGLARPDLEREINDMLSEIGVGGSPSQSRDAHCSEPPAPTQQG